MPRARGLGRGGLRLLGAQAGRPGPVVKGAPYSADTTADFTQALADGNKIHQTNSARIYRDSEGRTRREPSLSALRSAAPGGTVPQLVFITDPVAGVSYVLDMANHTAVKSVLPQPPNGSRPRDQRPPQPNVQTESLGRQTISGVPADGTRRTLTIPAGQIGNVEPIQVVTERWYSPDLQMDVLVRRSDPRTGDSVVQVTNIVRSEPAPSLFEVPPDFQVTQRPMRMRLRNGGSAPQ